MSARVDKDGDIEVFCANCDSWASAWQDEICPLMMAGVVIVEWAAMMADALPFGWRWGGWPYIGEAFGMLYAVHSSESEYTSPQDDDDPRAAWAAEYAARPRLEE